MKLSDKNKIQIDNSKQLYDALIEDYTQTKIDILSAAKEKDKEKRLSEEEFEDNVREHIADTYIVSSKDVVDDGIRRFKNHIYGYSILTDLIADDELSDIRCLSYKNIRVKRLGKRMGACTKNETGEEIPLQFESASEYRRFIDSIVTRNHVNISQLNAIQRFTDYDTSDKYILRFTVVTEYLKTEPWPELVVRKVPKDFPTVNDLVEVGMFTDEIKDILVESFRSGSTIICGANSSGKTTLLNALKETLPHDVSVLVAQQADELTTKSHPDMTFMHSIPGNAESDAVYDLEAISIAGLTMDIDFFIIGEVKGREAVHLLNAAYTGQLAACTVHAPSADKAINKIIDYALSGSKYTKTELLKMMDCFNTIIFMKDYKVNQIYSVRGYDYDRNEMSYYPIYENGRLIRNDETNY